MMLDSVLVLFCKRPALGFGKQRLAADLGEQAAYEIAVGLLGCALEDLACWEGPVVISPSAVSEKVWAESLLHRERVSVIPQAEGNLGERIMQVDRELRDCGWERLLIIGSDAPEMTPSVLREADRMLAVSDVVLSEAEDGGVSLMAARKAWPQIAGLPWSTSQLGDSLEKVCADAAQSVRWSKPCSDVDTVDDLKRISRSLVQDTRPARQDLLQVIGRWVQV